MTILASIYYEVSRYYLYCSSVLLFFLFSCESQTDRTIYSRLQQWDDELQDNPESIKDSLLLLNPQSLSKSNRAYYGLLRTIVDDKTYTDFTSDSLINAVEKYYANHDKGGNNHIRSLIYQGVLRYRMNIKDSTVLIPLKDAERYWHKQTDKDFLVGCFLYIYLAHLFQDNQNYAHADSFIRKALQYANRLQDPKYIFDTYYLLYFNEMVQGHNEKGKQYLDSLSSIDNLAVNQKYTLYNAQSIYATEIGDYHKALILEKKLMDMEEDLPFPLQKFKSYYTISDLYRHLNNLDSAMVYGLEAIRHIEDSTYELKYLFYQNIQDIAVAKKDYKTAEEYAREALTFYKNTTDRAIEQKVLELEKQYDVSKTENRVLLARMRNRIYVGILIVLSMIIVVIVIDYKQKRIIYRSRAKEAEAERRRIQLEKELIEQNATQQEKILVVFGKFLSEYGTIQNSLYQMVNRIKSKDAKLGEEFDQEIKHGARKFQVIVNESFSENLNEQFNIYDPNHILSSSDRMFLFMLSKQIPNEQIAALFNTSTHNLKTRKSVLKKKIMEKSNPDNKFELLLPLFSK